MSDINKTWNNVSNKKKKYQYSKKQENINSNLQVTPNNDFPSLPLKNSSRQIEPLENYKNTYDALGWKNSTSPKILDNIYSKAKKGIFILNEYPIFYDSPNIPLFN
jgi:hypothetical protein